MKKILLLILPLVILAVACVSYSKSIVTNEKSSELITGNKIIDNSVVENEMTDYQNEYMKALGLFTKNEYMNSLNILKGIHGKYIDVSSKISEIVGAYIQENIKKADSFIEEKKYREALECLKAVTKIYDDEKSSINSDKKLLVSVLQSTDKANLLEKSIELKRSYPVSILLYHSISKEPGNDLCLQPEKFRLQMQYLKEENYNIIDFDELYWYFSKDIPIPPKTVIVSLDDGYGDNYINAYLIVKELGVKATVFVITSTIEKHPLYLSSSQIREMDENNFRIESHSANHDTDKKLASLSYNLQLQSFKESKEALENLLNRKVETICYPFGSYNSDTIRAVRDSGYRIGVTIEYGRAEKSNGFFTLRRIYVGNKYSFDYFKELVKY